MIDHKSNNICQKYVFLMNQLLLLNFTILFFNVNKPQEDAFKTMQFNYFDTIFVWGILFLTPLHLWWSLAN